MSHSCLYDGRVRHRRIHPVRHAFTKRLFYLYLDLDELPRLFDRRWLWSARRAALAWFRRSDYLGDPAVPLADAVRDLVEERTGRRPTGPVRLLTHLRYFGLSFNPVSFYYCFDEPGERVETVVAEITNTPWGERHAYVVPGNSRHHRFAKSFHVSPFMGMDDTYDWSLPDPDERLLVHMENRRAGGRHFDATLTMRRRPLNGRTLAMSLLRFPFMTLGVVAGIYFEALRLWLKRAPFHAHPEIAR
ncbi:MAG: DUF1365 domain-containing protein [Planctomycetota bacterium]|jgi:DUF1365 family protein